ncbi:MAG TPA: dihydrodipicolinate synthase family protein [Acidimicrobiia bacterium]|nr:dihydrodipicolinate synthase family protein [Acidimicrobiia bacterium]
MSTVHLPRADGTIESYRLGTHPAVAGASGPCRSRVLYAAAHVVADPLGDPVGTNAIDWDATMAFRRHLWTLGFGVAEAMDTAQRGMGLDLAAVRILIDRSLAEAKSEGGVVACGITTDDLVGSGHTLDAIIASYLDQLSFVQERGGSVVMMASRALAASARHVDDYRRVYGAVLAEVDRPVIIHWLGPMFDPALAGYWGSADPFEAMQLLIGIVTDHAERIDGVKVSMLDESLEVEFRRSLPDGVRCYTGDDFNFPSLITGDGTHHSDALLGIFDAIAPVAMNACLALDAGDVAEFDRLLGPTVPLSRLMFEAPTFHYKTGLTFLAYLNGHQRHFRMLGGQESARSIVHLAELVRLADAAGLITDPDAAAQRLRPVLATAGIG